MIVDEESLENVEEEAAIVDEESLADVEEEAMRVDKGAVNVDKESLASV